MSRKIVRLTLDHLDALPEPVPVLPVLGAGPGTPRAGRGPAAARRTPGSRRCCASGAPAAGWPWSTTRRSATSSTPRRRSCPARRASRRRRSRRTRCCSPRVRRPGARGRRAGPDAGAGHGPRPDRARRHQGGRGVRRHPRAAGRLRACRWTSSAAWASRPSGRTATTPRMRMELRSTLTWKDEVEAALERLLGVVRPAHKHGARPHAEGDEERAHRHADRRRPCGRSGDESASSLSSAALGGRRRSTSRPRRPGRR